MINVCYDYSLTTVAREYYHLLGNSACSIALVNKFLYASVDTKIIKKFNRNFITS